MKTPDENCQGVVAPETANESAHADGNEEAEKPGIDDMTPIEVPRGIVQHLVDVHCTNTDCDVCPFYDRNYACWLCGESPCLNCKEFPLCKHSDWGMTCSSDCENGCWSFGRRARCGLDQLDLVGVKCPSSGYTLEDHDGEFTYFDSSHHPRNCRDFAVWYARVASEAMKVNMNTFAPKILLGLNPPFIRDYVEENDRNGWHEPGSPMIGNPIEHVKNSFGRWLGGPGKDKWRFDDLGRPFLSLAFRKMIEEAVGRWFFCATFPEWWNDRTRYYDDVGADEKSSGDALQKITTKEER